MARTADRLPDADDELVARIPGIVDLDAHVVEPPDVWSSRLPRQYRDDGPARRVPPGGHAEARGRHATSRSPAPKGPDVAWWFYEDHRYSVKRLIAAAGYPADEITLVGITFDDMRPGCWQPAARLADMDVNGVEAQLCFPNYPRFCGQLFLGGKDRELALLCVARLQRLDGRRVVRLERRPAHPVVPRPAVGRRARGRGGAAQRGARRARGRVQRAADVPRRCRASTAATGIRSSTRAQETGTVDLHAHRLGNQDAADVAGRARRGRGDDHLRQQRRQPHRLPVLGRAAPVPRAASVLYAECQIGWIPYLLERADDVWETHRGWSESRSCTARSRRRPTTTARSSSCFFKDAVGVEMLERVGVDNIMFETDYPHQDGTWPNSRQAAAEQFGHLDDDDRRTRSRGATPSGCSASISRERASEPEGLHPRVHRHHRAQPREVHAPHDRELEPDRAGGAPPALLRGVGHRRLDAATGRQSSTSGRRTASRA